MLDAITGAAGGEALLTRLYDWFTADEAKQAEPTKVESAMALRFDLPPGVTSHATALSADSGLNVDLGLNY